MDACTIVARNYLPQARVFAESLTALHPDCRVTVLVIDGPSEPSDQSRFRTVQLEDIIPDAQERRRQTFMYDVTELSTAVKPLLLRHLLAEGAPSVLYFDPDVEFFAPVDHLWRLAEQHHIVLTPHVRSPIPEDGFEVSDLTVLRAGLFNLGFIGVGADNDRFLDWWSGRLRRHCVSDPANGMFVDQRWLDYVAAMFPHTVEKDPGCNVAYWNLHERAVTQTADGFMVDGVPLRFYHFSGFDPDIPHLLSQHQGPNPRVLLSEHSAVQELCRRYATRLRGHGHGAVAVQYGFSTLPDGTSIDFVMRRLFRRALLQAERTRTPLPPYPFGWEGILDWLNSAAPEAPRLTRYLFGLHQQRPDLQRSFPGPYGADADAYLNWVAFDPWAIRTIPSPLRPAFPVAGTHGEGPQPFRDGLNVAGYFKAELGVGEVARLVTAAARVEGFPVATVLNDRTLSRQEDAFEATVNDGPYPVTLVCANADEFPRAVDALPVGMRDHCHRIGFWFWETERLPEAYRPASDLLDEIWVASEYVADAVRTTVTKPVRICPVPVRQFDPAPLSRAELGLPEGFLFLFMFDFLSNIHRKNPIGLVTAFCRAFRPGEGPMLMLKSINGSLARGAQEALRAAIGSRPDVIALDGYMVSATRDALMKTCDCYVSLHRSEGYGLTMAEAMTLGKPTIATAYSGNLAFMTAENSFLVPCRPSTVPAGCAPYPEGDSWAEPDLDAAASIMRLVWENPGLAKDRGTRGRVDVLERCSPARTISFIRERLAEIRHQREGDIASAVASPAPQPPPAMPVEAPLPPQDEGPERIAADDAIDIEAVCEQLALAEREAVAADTMLAGGIPFGTPSRFGWPGQVLRTAVMRLIRPYAHFEARAQRHHLQSTQRIIGCLRKGVPAERTDRRAGN
jgi:glycosyltransferase involved in cell wall biosynthesis